MTEVPLGVSPPDFTKLGTDEIHVWRASLDVPTARMHTLERTLSADEREKARRFRFPKDRRRYVVARGLLRVILGRYLNMHPGQISFRYGQQGKPSVDERIGGEALRFNLSHSQEIAVYAVSLNREVGIDLEHLRGDSAEERLAAQFLSPSEVSTFNALPARLRKEAFYKCWTIKEAYLKARGEGLALDPKQLEVSLIPGMPPKILSTGGGDRETPRWSVLELALGKDYATALAVEGVGFHISCRQLTL